LKKNTKKRGKVFFLKQKNIPLHVQKGKIMYAIVEIAGQQFKVEQGQEIYVHRLKAEEGEQFNIDKVLLTDNDGLINIGKPTVYGASVTATVL
jgi:large subunit ribosomal protein L21